MANLPFTGDLKHRVTIQRRLEESNLKSAMGANTITYEDVFTTWAYKEDIAFEDIYNNRGTGRGVSTDVFVIRNSSKTKVIDTEFYVLHRDKRYKMRGLKDIGAKDRFLSISCEFFERNIT